MLGNAVGAVGAVFIAWLSCVSRACVGWSSRVMMLVLQLCRYGVMWHVWRACIWMAARWSCSESVFVGSSTGRIDAWAFRECVRVSCSMPWLHPFILSFLPHQPLGVTRKPPAQVAVRWRNAVEAALEVMASRTSRDLQSEYSQRNQTSVRHHGRMLWANSTTT